ncbi:MAG: sulfotransferase domain-containing protein, partial [Myxococcota bacterium]
MSRRDTPRLQQRDPAFALRARWYRTPLARALRRVRRRRAAETYVVSFPKAGRTWRRVLLSEALTRHFGVAASPDFKLWRLAEQHPELTPIRFSHDENPHWKTPAQLVARKTEFRDCRVILLVRDFRDLVVSAYFQASRRSGVYDGDLASFVHSPAGSIATMVRFYNHWAANRDVPRDFMLLRYEELHADPAAELRRVLDFLGVSGVAP